MPERSQVDQDDELVHQVCCRDHDTALCGRDVSRAAWKPKGKGSEHDCVVCEDLNLGGVCPLYGKCTPNLYP